MLNGCNETCFDYFNCRAYDCIRREQLETPCWEIDDVRCKSHSEEFERLKQHLGSKREACKLCVYYKLAHEEIFQDR
jgi:hypothetical protein